MPLFSAMTHHLLSVEDGKCRDKMLRVRCSIYQAQARKKCPTCYFLNQWLTTLDSRYLEKKYSSIFHKRTLGYTGSWGDMEIIRAEMRSRNEVQAIRERNKRHLWHGMCGESGCVKCYHLGNHL